MIKKQNQRLERELTEVAEKHEAEMNLLRGQYDRLKNSIQFIQTQNRDPLGQFWPLVTISLQKWTLTSWKPLFRTIWKNWLLDFHIRY